MNYRYSYRFRADFMSQVDELKALLQGAEFETVPSVDYPPDVDVWLHTNMRLDEVLKAMMQIHDIAVLIETVNYLELYTGKRIYARSKGDWNGQLFG